MYSASASECADTLRSALRPVARVCETGIAHDLAFSLSGGRFAVVRCVDRASVSDYATLKAMVAEGDFIWAGLLYGDHNGSGPESPIESFHLTEIEKLTARLRALGAQGP
jgi:hypothetical protein